ncbi:acyl-CoA thioesterase [Streptomyces sp. V2]|uniref:acyl-CoA thioester hydrolase/BAAT C-terminal domain-containing protein n=1 Tax=Streptomyces sp. V2 TaxID=1424099 RepID=UPI000D66FF7C|nr:acyl-CoA thioester hydrolase/BAAT C-terminal domain-containing protein [Streptomyces sp. V2]PWG14890.1 acyl-CoA thioesterase [Streptomyces sp. V2]
MHPDDHELVRAGGTGVLVLAGSSGRVERERVRLLAEHGLTALSIRWFGGPGQPAGIDEVPLETFTGALDLLGTDRVTLLGTSKGAEAALLTAAHDPRVAAVVAVSPTSLVWSSPHGTPCSSWTWRGRPLPYVPMDDTWPRPAEDPVAVRGWYERSERTFARLLPAARIPVSRAALLLVAGGDDAMWPSLPHAEDLAARHPGARLVSDPEAGHRVRFPGETPLPQSPRFRYGGTPEADARLGAAAWPHVLATLLG